MTPDPHAHSRVRPGGLDSVSHLGSRAALGAGDALAAPAASRSGQ